MGLPARRLVKKSAQPGPRFGLSVTGSRAAATLAACRPSSGVWDTAIFVKASGESGPVPAEQEG